MSQDPAAKWQQETDRYASICKRVLAASPSIRYAGTINQYGRTLTGFIRPGTSPMLGREQAKNEMFVLSTMVNLRKETEDAIGKLEHILIRHEKVKIVLIASEKVVYYVTIDGKEEKYMNLVGDIKNIIR